MNRILNPEIECIPFNDMKKIQNKNLKKIVKYCYDNVPFYKVLFDKYKIDPKEIQSVDDLSLLPFTYKEDLRNNYPFGMLAVPRNKLARIHASSGTSGKKTVVGYTEQDINMWTEDIARSLFSYGISSENSIQVAYGYGLFTGGLGLHYGAERIGASVIPASSGNTFRQMEMITDFESDVLCCTPSYAMFIAEELQKAGINSEDTSLKIGIFGAEPWSNALREKLEKSLGIDAYDIYGLSEIMGPGVAFECSEKNGMHVNEDRYLIEVVDPETREVLPDGEEGEVVFTTLQKEAMPLLRYSTRDIASIRRENCSCGRTLVKMSKLNGRVDDMLIVRGVNVFPSQIEDEIFQMSMISSNYQIVIDRNRSLDQILLLVEIDEKYKERFIEMKDKLEKLIRHRLLQVLGINIEVQLVKPQTLPRTSGKMSRIIDKR